MEQQLIQNIENNKKLRGSFLLASLRAIILLLIYTAVFFFTFYYGHSNSPNAIEFFWSGFDNYSRYFVIAFGLSLWRSISRSFYKQLIKVIGILVCIDLVTMFIPAGFGSLGQALVYFEIYALPILVVALILFYLTQFLINWRKTLTFLNILFFLPLCFFIYANNHDLGVKSKILYENNSMFTTIEECSAYIYKVRVDDCRKDWITMHERWDSMEKTANINLDPNLKPVPGSENYQYFPPENISDVKIGTGELAKYGDKAVVKIYSEIIRGKTYDNLDKSVNLNLYTNASYWDGIEFGDYESYAFGVIGMRIGGVRLITFKTLGFWGSDDDIGRGTLVKKDELLTYKVELNSLGKGLDN